MTTDPPPGIVPDPPPSADPEPSPDVSIRFDPISLLLREGRVEPPTQLGTYCRLENYGVLGVLGEGGMGFVLLARDSETGRRVAIKVLKPDLADIERVVRRFLQEAEYMKRLATEHPHIVKVIDVVRHPKLPFFVMPHMEGGSLADRLRSGEPLDPAEVVRIALPMARALSHAHMKGIIHKDFKPGNILVDKDGEPWLADFGLCRDTNVNDSMLAHSWGGREGTAAYMEPDRLVEGRSPDWAADIYSFGATLYEMLTGRPTYHGATPQEVLEKVSREAPPPILSVNPAAPKPLVRIAEAAMARDRYDRYREMADLVADLERVVAGQKPLGPHHRLRGHHARPSRIIAGVSFLLLVALGFYGSRFGPGARDDPAGTLFRGHIGDDELVSVEVLFGDDFRDAELDPALWEVGQLNELYLGTLGELDYSVSQLEGDLVVSSRSVSERGWSTGQMTWVNSRADLKLDRHSSSAHNVLIELAYSFSVISADVWIELSHDRPTTHRHDGSSVVLIHHQAPNYEPLAHERRYARVMLYGERDRAIVYRGDAEEDSSSEATSLEFTDVLDVSELGGWNLRFRVHTRSSSGIPEGNAELRVHHVAAARIEGPMSLVGCVTDARTGLPIQGVRVRSDSITTAGRPKVCSTNRRGMYALALKPGQERLIEVEAKGFNCSQVQWAVYANLGEQIIKDIRLDRIELRHGDPIRAIPIPAGGAMSLAATSSSLIFNSDEGDPGILRRLSLDDGRVEEILETMTLSGLVEGPDGLYGVTTWPGRLIRIEPDGGTTPRYPLNLDYPRGLAWDGVRLWFVESDNVRGVYQLRAIDLDTGEQVVQLPTSHAIWGVACRGDRLYVCAPRNDQVYEVSLSKALRGTRLEAAVVGEFTGAYRYLTFSDDGRLWAIDAENQMFVEIHLE